MFFKKMERNTKNVQNNGNSLKNILKTEKYIDSVNEEDNCPRTVWNNVILTLRWYRKIEEHIGCIWRILWIFHFRTLYNVKKAEKYEGWKVHMKTSHLLLMIFLTNEIQALQHQWKKCVDNNGVYVEK